MLLSSLFSSLFQYHRELESILEKINQAIMTSESVRNMYWGKAYGVKKQEERAEERELLQQFNVQWIAWKKLDTGFQKVFLESLKSWKTQEPGKWQEKFAMGVRNLVCYPYPQYSDYRDILDEARNQKLEDNIRSAISSEISQALKKFPVPPCGVKILPGAVCYEGPLYLRSKVVKMAPWKKEPPSEIDKDPLEWEENGFCLTSCAWQRWPKYFGNGW